MSERISLQDTKRKTYQTEHSVDSRRVSSTDLVSDYDAPRVTTKQVVYLFLAISILVSAIAVTFFTWSKHDHNGHKSHNYNSVLDAADSSGASALLETSSDSNELSWFLEDSVCYAKHYLKQSLKLQYSASFGGIVLDLQNTYKYEASGVRFDRMRNKFFVVFDSLYGLGAIDPSLQRSSQNIFLPDQKNQVLGESGFEGLALDPENNDLYLVTEAVEYGVTWVSSSTNIGDVGEIGEIGEIDNIEGKSKSKAVPLYRALISHVALAEDHYNVSAQCMVGYNFTSSNKGLEGLSLLQNVGTGKKFFLGLCEGNYCHGSDLGKNSGHGRMLVISFEKEQEAAGEAEFECVHKVQQVIELPESVYFTDYSAMSFRHLEGTLYKVLIVSQEDSAVWKGEFDLDAMEFSKDGDVYVFPRELGCVTTLCNVEGIDWIDENTVVVVSDKTKSSGRQPFECSLGDQSIFIMTIP